MKKSIALILFGLIVTFGCVDKSWQVSKPRDCASRDIEKIDSCLLGQTIKIAIEKLKIDATQFYAFDEPPGILRGLEINIADSCKIVLLVERTSIIDRPILDSKQNYQYIIDKKIIGVNWVKKNKSRSIGVKLIENK